MDNIYTNEELFRKLKDECMWQDIRCSHIGCKNPVEKVKPVGNSIVERKGGTIRAFFPSCIPASNLCTHHAAKKRAEIAEKEEQKKIQKQTPKEVFIPEFIVSGRKAFRLGSHSGWHKREDVFPGMGTVSPSKSGKRYVL